MELNDLKEYLRLIVEMEKDIFLKEELMADLKTKIKIEEPYISYQIKKPHEPKYLEEHSSGIITASGWMAAILGIFGILLIIADSFFGVLLTIGAGILGCLFLSWKDVKSANEKKRSDYFRQQEEYNKEVKEDSIRRKKVQDEKEALCHTLNIVNKKVKESKGILAKFYSKDIVFPKYRNFVMMCSIYEYICSGRCTTLEGPDGAYNILEMEIRMDRVIVQLDRVLSSLNQIQANQYMLCDAIQEGNRIRGQIMDNTNQIISSMNRNGKKLSAVLESIDKNSALTAYAAERSQKELEYMNTMNYLESKWSGTGFNQPPSWRS
ncbi:MAG: hypothetical protein LUF29_04660 [Oscillospiraceae bacterium]|nr:hypothetical protein [Oscillospiraceae bacterium]